MRHGVARFSTEAENDPCGGILSLLFLLYAEMIQLCVNCGRVASCYK